jgi:hypothetical protein
LSPELSTILEIADDDTLYRRLAPNGHHTKPDGSVSSNAYKLNGRPDPAISVDLARLSSPEESAARALRPGYGIGAITARSAKDLGLVVRHDPTPENPSHSIIEGNKSKENCTKLAERTNVVIEPELGIR